MGPNALVPLEEAEERRGGRAHPPVQSPAPPKATQEVRGCSPSPATEVSSGIPLPTSSSDDGVAPWDGSGRHRVFLFALLFQVNSSWGSHLYHFGPRASLWGHIREQGLLTLCGWEGRDELIFSELQHFSVRGPSCGQPPRGPKQDAGCLARWREAGVRGTECAAHPLPGGFSELTASRTLSPRRPPPAPAH